VLAGPVYMATAVVMTVNGKLRGRKRRQLERESVVPADRNLELMEPAAES